MARQGAFPEAFGRVHPRFLTPHVSTIAIGVIASVWFGVLFPLSENFVYDSLTSLAFMIAFYYALTGFACAIYYRRELTKSVKNFFFIGVGPVVGGLILTYLFFKAIDEYRDPASLLLGQRGLRHRRAGGARRRVAAAGRGADDRLAAHRPRRVLRPSAVRSWTPTWQPAASSAWPRCRRRRSDGRDRAGIRRFARSQVGARVRRGPRARARRRAGDRLRGGPARRRRARSGRRTAPPWRIRRRAHTAEALAEAEQAGVTASVELVPERPAAALVDGGRRPRRPLHRGGHAGARARSGARSSGSTPHKLLHLSHRPVVVVPAA